MDFLTDPRTISAAFALAMFSPLLYRLMAEEVERIDKRDALRGLAGLLAINFGQRLFYDGLGAAATSTAYLSAVAFFLVATVMWAFNVSPGRALAPETRR